MIEEEDYKLPATVATETPAGEAAGTAAEGAADTADERKRKADATLAYLKGLPWRPFGWGW